MSSLFGSVISDGNIIANGISFSNGKVRGIMVKSDGGLVIDGKEYKADEVTVRTEYKIKSTGKTVYTEPGHLTIKVTGDNATVHATSQSGSIELECEKSCSANLIKTMSGDVRLSGDAETISTMSGDVTVDGSVKGDIKTMSGNVRCKGR
jgi:hypothetical protein